MQRLAPWPVTFLDPAPAIARRVVDLIGPAVDAATKGAAPAEAIFTSGREIPPALVAALGRFGIVAAAPGAFDTFPLSA